MVRKDPLNERGPKPPGGRPIYTNGKRRVQLPNTLFELHPEEEYIRLWTHVLYGSQTCIKMIEGYAELGMPGDPLPQLVELKKRVDRLVEIFSQEGVKHDNE